MYLEIFLWVPILYIFLGIYSLKFMPPYGWVSLIIGLTVGPFVLLIMSLVALKRWLYGDIITPENYDRLRLKRTRKHYRAVLRRIANAINHGDNQIYIPLGDNLTTINELLAPKGYAVKSKIESMRTDICDIIKL